MGKVSYPFAALPNQVCRGGHGAINVAVLAVLLSHGRTSASAQTLADEIGCDRKSVFKSFKYWQTEGPNHGIHLRTGERKGCTTVIEIDVLICREESTTSTENGTGIRNDQYRKGDTAVPNTEQAPVPKTAHKEEPVRRPLKKNLPLPPQGGEGKIFVPGRGPRRAKPYIEGDLAPLTRAGVAEQVAAVCFGYPPKRLRSIAVDLLMQMEAKEVLERARPMMAEAEVAEVVKSFSVTARIRIPVLFEPTEALVALATLAVAPVPPERLTQAFRSRFRSHSYGEETRF